MGFVGHGILLGARVFSFFEVKQKNLHTYLNSDLGT
jgi:hypothetical protein